MVYVHLHWGHARFIAQGNFGCSPGSWVGCPTMYSKGLQLGQKCSLEEITPRSMVSGWCGCRVLEVLRGYAVEGQWCVLCVVWDCMFCV